MATHTLSSLYYLVPGSSFRPSHKIHSLLLSKNSGASLSCSVSNSNGIDDKVSKEIHFPENIA